MPSKFQLFVTGFFLLAGINLSYSQAPEASIDEPPFIFLDCNARNCDFNHFRQEIKWVNWVREREDSDVHLLITSQTTGGGGQKYTLTYIGRRELENKEKTIEFITRNTDTDTEVRDQLSNSMAMGLIQFVENSPEILSRLRISFDEPTEIEETVFQSELKDPWNLWTFRLGADGSMDGESFEKAYGLEGSLSANRVSEDLKINFNVNLEYEREEFDDIDEGETFVDISEDYSARALMVWSLNSKWSIGGTSSLNRSTFLNRDLAFFLGPALEYNIFPYSESTRRAITFRYTFEIAAFNYELQTVEFKDRETLPRHTLLIGAAVQQPWGEIFGSIEGIQYLHDPSTHRINTFLNLEYRLFRGFGIDIFASFSRIKDQFYLPAEGLSLEEILLRRRQRETDHRFNFGLGFSYRFGSKYANVVNTRMSRGRGRGRGRFN